MFCGDGKELEDIREIKIDKGLRKLCEFKNVPSADAIGQGIRKEGNLEGLRKVKEDFIKQVIALSGKNNFTVDTDATFIETKKAFTLLVQRWVNKQPDLFEQDYWRYHVIATNDYKRKSAEIICFHNKRDNSENYNKEIKNDFGRLMSLASDTAPGIALKFLNI